MPVPERTTQLRWSAAFWTPWLLFLVALVVRLAFVLFYEQFPALQADDAIYDSVAVDLASGRGFIERTVSSTGVVDEPLIRIGPTYPAFLAILYFLFGHSLTVVRVVQAVLGATTVLLVFRSARAAFGEPVALMAGALTALHPALIIYTGMILTETLFAFLLTLSVWAMIVAAKHRSPLTWLRAGVVLGLTILLRAEALALAVLFAGSALWCGEGQHKKRNLLILGTALALTVGAWTVRNYVVFKEVILVSDHSGPTIWISTMGWSEWRYDDALYQSIVRQETNSLEQGRALRREAIKNIRNDPARYLRFCLERIPAFWLGSHTTYLAGFSDSFQAYYVQGKLDKVAVKLLLLSLNIGLLGLGLWGIWASILKETGQRCLRILCLHPIVVIATVHFFLFAASRYQVPILPAILMFSAVGVNNASSLFRSKG